MLPLCRYDKEDASLEEKMLIAKAQEDWWNERKAALIALRDEWRISFKDN